MDYTIEDLMRALTDLKEFNALMDEDYSDDVNLRRLERTFRDSMLLMAKFVEEYLGLDLKTEIISMRFHLRA